MTSKVRYPLPLPIADREVMQVTVSRYGPYLQLEFFDGTARGSDRDAYTLAIDGPFTLETREGSMAVDPANPSPALLALRTMTVREAIADEDGTLRLTFTDGNALRVPPGEYEPWQFVSKVSVGDDGWLVVSAAGGGLAVWLPAHVTFADPDRP